VFGKGGGVPRRCPVRLLTKPRIRKLLALVRAPNSASDSFDDCYRTNALPLGMLDSAFEATFLTLVIAFAIAVIVLIVSRWWR
jgi:hypothetical protein